MGSIGLDNISSPAMRAQAQAKYAEVTGKPKAAAKPKGKAAESELEVALLGQLRMAGLPKPERQVVFAPPRKWRFDGAWPAVRIAYEVDGGTRSGGRHVRGDGYEGDARKLNTAQLQGWQVFRFTAAMVDSGEAVATLKAALTKGTP